MDRGVYIFGGARVDCVYTSVFNPFRNPVELLRVLLYIIVMVRIHPPSSLILEENEMAKCWRVESLKDEDGRIPAKCVTCMDGPSSRMKRLMCYKGRYTKAEQFANKAKKRKETESKGKVQQELRAEMVKPDK